MLGKSLLLGILFSVILFGFSFNQDVFAASFEEQATFDQFVCEVLIGFTWIAPNTCQANEELLIDEMGVLVVDSDVILDMNFYELTIEGGIQNVANFDINTSENIINQNDGFIENGGTFNINVDNSGGLLFTPVTNAGFIGNSGTFNINVDNSGGTISNVQGLFTNSDVIENTGSFNVNINNDGGIIIHGGSTNIQNAGGIIINDGTIDINVTNDGIIDGTDGITNGGTLNNDCNGIISVPVIGNPPVDVCDTDGDGVPDVLDSNPNAFTAVNTGDWNDGSTWEGGIVPGETDDKEILAGVIVSVSTPIVNSATLDILSSGNLQNLDFFTNTGGTINILAGGNFSVGGTFINNPGGVINLSDGGGIVTVGGFVNRVGGTINSSGSFSIASGNLDNSGTINIDGGGISMVSSSTLNNLGTINNFALGSGITTDGIVNNSGTIDNSGIINDVGNTFFDNSGTIINQNSAQFSNNLTITNSGDITNHGSFTGSIDNSVIGTVTNTGTIFSDIVNDNIFDNSGTMLVSSIINNIGGVVTNTGTYGNALDPGTGVVLSNSGQFDNSGDFFAFDLATNNQFTNTGTITFVNHDNPKVLDGTVDNFGTINDLQKIDLSGTVNNHPSATINFVLDDFSRSENSFFGNLINNAGGIINFSPLLPSDQFIHQGSITNFGTVNNSMDILNNGVIDNSDTINNDCTGIITGNPVTGIQPIDICDTDDDGVIDTADNCPAIPNPLQEDFDVDGLGDVCDTDDDNDTVSDDDEINTYSTDPFNPDTDGDGANDGIEVLLGDTDGDGTGNALDTDDDGDNVPTTLEDHDGNGDPTNDDFNTNSIADYLDNTQGLVCPPGSFAPLGDTTCTLAPPGSFVDSQGAISATLCSPGFFQDSAGQIQCNASQVGFFVPISGALAATPCSPGTFANDTALISCFDAPPGKFVPIPAAFDATSCNVGTYQPLFAQIQCLLADAGNFVDSIGSPSQELCPLGFFQPLTGQSSCNEAPAGEFVDSTGAITTELCPLGFFQPLTGQSSCNEADIGHFVSTTGSASQTACPVDTYQPATGQTSCESDPPVLSTTTTDPTGSDSATFSFTAVPGAGFECSIDALPFLTCLSPDTHSSLDEGAHTFAVRATDTAGNISPVSAFNWIVDLSPPVLTIPEDFTVQTTDDSGVVVNYVVTATDNLDTSVDISCSPVSGSIFAVDTMTPTVTTVNCNATDDVGNVSNDSFDVTTEFIATIPFLSDYVESLGLPNGIENSLLSKLDNAQDSFDNGNTNAGINQLNAFINQVQAQSGKKIDSADAQFMIDLTNAIIANS